MRFKRIAFRDLRLVMGLLVVLLIAGLISLLTALFGVVQANNLPKELEDCLEPYQQPTILGRVEADGTVFFLIRTGVNPRTSFDALISVSGGICTVENRDRSEVDQPLIAFISQDIAHQLAIDRLQWIVEQEGGKSAYQTKFNQFAAASKQKLFMPRESYQALVSMGFVIPSNIVATDEPPAYDQAIADRH